MIAQQYRKSYPKVSDMLEEELEFTLTYLAYPSHHRRKIRTTNLDDPLLEEIKQMKEGVNTQEELVAI